MTRGLVLLDKPSERSFGMTAIVVENNGEVRVLGLAPSSAARGRALTEAQVGELIQGGHALSLEHVALPDGLTSDTVALWLGDAFLERAKALALPPAPLPASPVAAEGGTFFLGPAKVMYPYLDLWTVAAFRRFRDEPDPVTRSETASLMRWVLPDRPESLAAAWRVSAQPARELQLQLRTFAHERTEASLRAEHEKNLAAHSAGLADLRLVAFTGGTGAGRDEVATRFAKQFALDITTFRRPIDERVAQERAHLSEIELKYLQMDEGQAEVETSPLGLAIEALRAVRPHRNILVVDSVRHRKIWDTLQWLRPKKLFVVAVMVDRSTQLRRVVERKLDPDRIFQHGTEREIQLLSAAADRQVEETVPDSELRSIFEAVQS